MAGASGSRNVGSGAMAFEGSDGCYWSASSYSATFGFSLLFTSGLVNPQYAYNRGDGFPLRCIQGFALRGADSSVRVKLQEDATVRASGYRDVGSGAGPGGGLYGYFWSVSPVNASNGLVLHFQSSTVFPQNHYNRGFGYPLRCIQEFALRGAGPDGRAREYSGRSFGQPQRWLGRDGQRGRPR